MKPATIRQHAGGFSLLELLIAVAVLAMALGVMYRALGGAVRTVGDTSGYLRATALAESLLQSRATVPPSGWQESGTWDVYRWTVHSAVYEAPGPQTPVLHRVRVDVSWADATRPRVVSLVTLKPEVP